MTRRRRTRNVPGPAPGPDASLPADVASEAHPDASVQPAGAPGETPEVTAAVPPESGAEVPPARVAPMAGARALAQDFLAGWRGLLELSQPRAWPITALPFAVAAYDAARGFDPGVILGTLYFMGPYNLLLHGLDAGHRTWSLADPRATADVDPDTDPATRDGARLTRLAIALTNLPFVVVLVLLGGAAAGLALLLAVAAAVAYSMPPIRTSGRPVLDSVTSALHVVLPAACGFLIGGRTFADLPWLALAAFASWAVATDMLGAIVHLARDRAAGATSIATALGARLTAALSLVLYAVSALLSATMGRPGALAALGLGLYLLLPAMVLLAPRHDPAAVDEAAQRAWSDFLGLRYVVGLWLALLLLRHWGVFVGLSGLEIVIVASALAAGYAGLNTVAIRLATRRRRTHPAHEREILPLTIVVPCLDDGERLAACLDAMLEQTYADTAIVVVDGGSSDGSPELAAEILGGAGRVIVAPPTPEDWSASNWARWIGVQATEGDLVLFVDVDTIPVPVATRLLVEQLENGRWDLLSGVPRYDMPTVGERAAVPGFAMLLFGFGPIWLSALTGGRPARVAFANGSLMLLRRDAYLASGGHAAVPDSLREDIDLAHTFARAGRRVGTARVADLAASRHVTGPDAAVSAWRRSILGGSLAVTVLALALEGLAYVLPMVLPPLALLSGVEARTLVASFIPLFLLGFARFALVLTQRQPLTTVFWHPVTVGLTLIGQLAGLVDHVTGRSPSWRDLRPMTTTATPDHQT
jgi:4-hydroxybenzoate polyprenyltransferase